MTSLLIRALAGTCLIQSGSIVAAQEMTAIETVEGPHGTALLPSPSPGSGAQSITFDQMSQKALEGQVINSNRRFSPSQLPATFTARFADGSFCTATLVGPRVLLTAAHCIDLKERDERGAWMTVSGGIRLSGEAAIRPFKMCEMAPAYVASKPKLVPSPRNSHDYALCELVEKVPLKAETLDLKNAPGSGMPLLIAGYGCSEQDLESGRIPTTPTEGLILRAGINRVQVKKVGAWITLIGRVGSSDAIICPGDSGGSAYAGATLLEQAYSPGWRVVAINSAVGLSSASLRTLNGIGDGQGTGVEYISYLSPLSDPKFAELLSSFMGEENPLRAICGINRFAPATRCRP